MRDHGPIKLSVYIYLLRYQVSSFSPSHAYIIDIVIV